MAQVLFVCVHNAGRSQMAKALFNHLARQRGLPFRAESAGTQPAPHIHPTVAETMREVGIDLSLEHPKALTDAMVRQAQRVIVMGCAVDTQACPAILLRDVEDWGLPDPKDLPLPQVRAIRDTVRQKVEALLTQLEAEGAGQRV
ncbi:Arsenate-mycothiol transferase ArsC2 [bacterium HR23]|nr:Arsenate-mycothiol transferase ArsC2 [bacterium HR23]